MSYIKPGVFTQVRDEGLTGVAGIATGVIGVVGTARKGEMDAPITLTNLNQAIATFGLYDAYASASEGDELTLVRAMEQMFNNGAGTVIAVRIDNGSAAKASGNVASASGNCASLTALSEGVWGNGITVAVVASDRDAIVNDEDHTGVTADQTATWWEMDHGSNNSTPVVDARTVVREVTNTGTEKLFTVVWTTTGAGSAPNPGYVNIEAAGADNEGRLWFNAAEIPPSTSTLYLTYVCGSGDCVKVTLTDSESNTVEEYYTPCGDQLAYLVNAASTLVSGTPDATNPTEKPTAYTGTKSLSGGNNGATSISSTHVEGGLGVLATETVNLVYIPYPVSASDTTFYDKLSAHVVATEGQRKERIGLLGHQFDDDTVSEVKATAGYVADTKGRIVLVSPGIQMANRSTGATETVGAPYAAAAVTGLIASLRPHEAPTNKVLAGISQLQVDWNYGEHEQLIENRVLALEVENGVRVVRGMTASTVSSWRQITTRRIVDYCLAGTRSAAQDFIGRLNNKRVRAACKAAIGGFLDRMLRDEMIIAPYEVDVVATRDDEIAGIARVEMTIRPVFSIEYIDIVMTLE